MSTIFRKDTLQQRIDALAPTSDVFLPDGQGRFPVVIQFHGCGGKKLHQPRWAEVARQAGWAAVVADSYAHRGISKLEAYATVCTGLRLWGRERAGDLYALVEWARQQPWADPDRIVLAGWSHGAWTVLDAMALHPGADAEKETRLAGIPAEPMTGVIGAFLLYPWQGFGALAPHRGLRWDVPVQAIVGSADSVVGGKGVAKTLAAMKTPRAPIAVDLFEGATHAFDEEEVKDMRMRYDPVLTERAREKYRAFLGAMAGGRS